MEQKFTYISAINCAVKVLNEKKLKMDELYKSCGSLEDIVHATNSVIIQAHELKVLLDFLVEDIDNQISGYYRMTDV